MEARRLSFTHQTDTGTIRRAATPFLDDSQDADQVRDSLLVITELVQNVMRHTCSGGDLVLSHCPGGVLIEVSDASADLPEALAPDPRRVGGRGLLLVRAMSLAWGVRPIPGGKTVWATIAAGPRAAA
jgi:hypothetical protein